MAACFGEFRFNRDARILFRHGRVVPLMPRELEFLGILLDRRPKPVTRPELERLLWPDAYVPENGLSKIALDVRRALDDQDRCSLIRTVRNVGYAFIGEAREQTEDPPANVGTWRARLNGREIGLVEGENWIGRGAECRVQVGCSLVSRRHACIVVSGLDATLRDGPSRNGTFLNHERLTRPATLHHRDEIRVGSQYLAFHIIHPDKPTDKAGSRVAGRRVRG